MFQRALYSNFEVNFTPRYTRDISEVRSHCFTLEKYATTKHET